jgi:hypothetical protein
MDEEWLTIKEAPTYEINDKGQVRSKWSKRFLKIRDDGHLDDPYVLLMVDGVNLRRSVYVLLREAQVNARS